MTTTWKTALGITSWNENPYRELPDGTKFTRAEVTLDGAEPATGEAGDPADELTISGAAFEALMYYRADGTSSYVTVFRLEAGIGGRQGSLVLTGDGAFDGAQARMTLTAVDGSGTGPFEGCSGTASSVSTHDDYPNMPLTLSIVGL